MKTDLKVVLIDTTNFWSKKFLAKGNVTKVQEVRLFDANVHTHCCEITPSYELNLIYGIPVSEKQTSDEWEMEFAESMNIDNDQVEYWHCSGIDKMKAIKIDFDFEFKKADSEEYREQFEEVIEYLNCNHII